MEPGQQGRVREHTNVRGAPACAHGRENRELAAESLGNGADVFLCQKAILCFSLCLRLFPGVQPVGGGGSVREPLGKGHVCTCPGPPGQASGGQQLQSFYSWFWLLSICHDCCIWPGKFFWYNGAPHLCPTLSRLVSYKAGSWIASGFNLLVILGLFDVSPSFRPGFEKGLFFFCDREMTRTQPYLSSKGSHICLLRAFSIQIHMMVFKGHFSILSLECIFVSYSCSLWAHFYFIRM